MDQTAMDILYFGFLALVVIGGVIAILILCPKENKLRNEKINCYRFIEKNGVLIHSASKPSLFEKKKKNIIYIEKGPFEVDAFFDELKGKDGKNYRLGAVLQLYLPERNAQTAADYLYSISSSFNQDSIVSVIRAEIETILSAKFKEYSPENGQKAFEAEFKEAVDKKLMVFGYELYCPLTLKISENKQKA